MQRYLQIRFAVLFAVLLTGPRLAFGQVTTESSAAPPADNAVAPAKTR